MSNSTPEEIRTLALASYSSLPRGSHIAPPMNFLSLAPTTSASYPVQPSARADSTATSTASSVVAVPAAKSPSEDASLAVVGAEPTAAEVIAEATKNRRSSSVVSSESAGSVKQRFLKLGPVHWGADRDGKGDWADVE